MEQEELQKLGGVVRVVQYYDDDPETGERRDHRYVLQQFDGWKWADVPVVYAYERWEDITKM